MLQTSCAEVNAYLNDPTAYVGAAKKACDHSARTNLEAIVDCLTGAKCESFADCVAKSRLQFEERFHHKIAQLTYMFPEDSKTSNGTTFWSPPKRFPKVVKFDASDASHAAYAQASAILFAQAWRCAASWPFDSVLADFRSKLVCCNAPHHSAVTAMAGLRPESQ